MRISDYLVSLVVIGLVGVLFMLWTSSAVTTYGGTYSNSSIQMYDRMQTITADVSVIQNETWSTKEKNNVLDIIGSFMANSYTAIKTSAKTMDLTNDIIEDSIEQNSEYSGVGGTYLKNALITILIILIVIGFVLYVFTKVPT